MPFIPFLFQISFPFNCSIVQLFTFLSTLPHTASHKKDKEEWSWSGLAELVKYSRVSWFSYHFYKPA